MRFSGHTNEWQTKRIDTLFEFVPNNTISRDGLNYDGGGWKNIHYGDILTVFPTVLDIRDWHVPYISSATFSSQSSLSTGDVVIADTAEDYTAGKALEVVISEGIKAVPGLHTIACHPKVSFAPGFLGYYLNSSAYIERLRPLIQGIKVYSISKSSLATTSISFPSHDEQYKIGLFLSIIDRRIAVQNKIIKELDDLMIALCKFMTIDPDATLAEVCECRTSTIKESVLSSSGKYPVYGATGLVGYLDTYDFEHPGLAVIKDGAGVGRNYPIDAARYSIIGTMALLLPRKDISITYLWASLQAMNFSSYVVGSGIPHIYFKDYKQSKIPNHSYSNICLSELAELIRKKRDGELEILSKMQVEKTYFLGNMFI